jgi:NADH-quinone oxidoreductase E subunit
MKFLTGNTEKDIKKILAQYENSRSAILPILKVIQEDYGYISDEAIEELSEILELKKGEIKEVISFYTMLKTSPEGKYHIQICKNVVCYLNGGKQLIEFLEKEYSVKVGGFSKDKKFSLSLVECIGQCEIAPAIQINNDFYGNMNPEKLKKLLSSLD